MVAVRLRLAPIVLVVLLSGCLGDDQVAGGPAERVHLEDFRCADCEPVAEAVAVDLPLTARCVATSGSASYGTIEHWWDPVTDSVYVLVDHPLVSDKVAAYSLDARDDEPIHHWTLPSGERPHVLLKGVGIEDLQKARPVVTLLTIERTTDSETLAVAPMAVEWDWVEGMNDPNHHPTYLLEVSNETYRFDTTHYSSTHIRGADFFLSISGGILMQHHLGGPLLDTCSTRHQFPEVL